MKENKNQILNEIHNGAVTSNSKISNNNNNNFDLKKLSNYFYNYSRRIRKQIRGKIRKCICRNK
jgi:hypothetical protein